MPTPMVWEGVPLVRNGSPAVDQACCCGGDTVTTCGCENLPTTLYVYDNDDDSLVTAITYADPMTQIPAYDGWEAEYGGGWIEFYCIEGTPDKWWLDDEEGGGHVVDVGECTGVIATFLGTGLGDVYISTEGP